MRIQGYSSFFWRTLLLLLSVLAPHVGDAQAISGYWEGWITHLGKKWSIGVEFRKDNSVWVDFIDIGGYHRVFVRKQESEGIYFERQQPNGRPPLIFDGHLKGDSLTGRWDGIGITGARFAVGKAKKVERTEQEVNFRNDVFKLSGTLLMPSGKGPFPALVFMHGGAPEDRNVYYGYALKFVRQGIAALIYDKRGVGRSEGGDWRLAGITGLAKDAIAGVEWLKTRREIDAKKIGVFGHSEGGWTAPMAATLSEDIAFVIASGASAVNATDQSVYHRMEVMRADGFSEEAIQKAAGIRERLNAASRLCYSNPGQARTEGLRVAQEIEAIHTEPWLESSALPYPYDPQCPSDEVMELLFKDPLTIWQQVKVPVYLTWGSDDKVVPVHKHGLIAAALKNSGNKNYKIAIVPDVDHSLYQVNKTGEWDFPRESQNYVEEMVAWTTDVTTKK